MDKKDATTDLGTALRRSIDPIAKRRLDAAALAATQLFEDAIPRTVRQAQRSGFFVGFVSGVFAGLSLAWVIVVARSF